LSETGAGAPYEHRTFSHDHSYIPRVIQLRLQIVRTEIVRRLQPTGSSLSSFVWLRPRRSGDTASGSSESTRDSWRDQAPSFARRLCAPASVSHAEGAKKGRGTSAEMPLPLCDDEGIRAERTREGTHLLWCPVSLCPLPSFRRCWPTTPG